MTNGDFTRISSTATARCPDPVIKIYRKRSVITPSGNEIMSPAAIYPAPTPDIKLM
jgi:hypothetical protein